MYALFFRSENPLDDDFIEVTPGTFEFWDPNLFQDDDGKVYFYWGCSNTTPLYGTRIDPATFVTVGDRAELVFADVERRGWEQLGENHIQDQHEIGGQVTGLVGQGPFIEGAWMDKHEGTYYLQYAAPGTEFNTYADGYLTSKSPLGPFEYSVNSPFSSKPGGFIAGAGHGSTFQDEYGNWWHASTMRVSINFLFERRVGLFPAGFDEDGVLFCNQNFADYPMPCPKGRFDPWSEVFAGWMLLLYRSHATASSSLVQHPPGSGGQPGHSHMVGSRILLGQQNGSVPISVMRTRCMPFKSTWPTMTCPASSILVHHGADKELHSSRAVDPFNPCHQYACR